MGTFIPSIHAIEQRVRLMNHKHGALYPLTEVGVRDDHCNFQKSVAFRLKTRHFTVQPDQVFVGFDERGGDGGV